MKQKHCWIHMCVYVRLISIHFCALILQKLIDISDLTQPSAWSRLTIYKWLFLSFHSSTFTQVTSPTCILIYHLNACQRILVGNWIVSQIFIVSILHNSNSEISAISRLQSFIKKFYKKIIEITLLIANYPCHTLILSVLIFRSALHEIGSIAKLFSGGGSSVSQLFPWQHNDSESKNYARYYRGFKRSQWQW